MLGAATLMVLIVAFCSNVLHLLKSPRPASYLIGAILTTYGLLYTFNTSVGRPIRRLGHRLEWFGTAYESFPVDSWLS